MKNRFEHRRGVRGGADPVKFARGEVDAVRGGKWRHPMSGSMSAAVRFEDHSIPLAPGAPRSPERSTQPQVSAHPGPCSSTAPLRPRDKARLDALVGLMRRSVIEATLAVDLAAKVELWESYRTARSEAIALIGSASDAPGTHRLRSV